MEAEDAETVAAEFVDRLQASGVSGNYDSAAELWTGYPYPETERLTRLRAFVDANPWLVDNRVSFDVVNAWSSGSGTPMKIVAITDLQRRGATAILLDLTGMIQRIQSDDDMVGEARIDGLEITIPEHPVEGGAIAYLGSQLLNPDSVRTDAPSDSTIISLPKAGKDVGLLIVSMATPELPTALSLLIGDRQIDSLVSSQRASILIS